MEIKKVWIEKGCTACGLCESICPEVFTVDHEGQVNTDVNFNEFPDQIKEAADSCPVEVIKYEETEDEFI
jgi:ferredoxin